MPLSAQLAGLNAATCTVSPATATFQNEFYYNPTTTTTFFFGRPSSQPLNNGLAKGDWNINEHNHVSVFYYDSRSTGISDGTYTALLGHQQLHQDFGNLPGLGLGRRIPTWVNDIANWSCGHIGRSGEHATSTGCL